MSATFNDYLAAAEKSKAALKLVKKNNRLAGRLKPVPGAWDAFDAYVAARDEAWRVYKSFRDAHNADVLHNRAKGGTP